METINIIVKHGTDITNFPKYIGFNGRTFPVFYSSNELAEFDKRLTTIEQRMDKRDALKITDLEAAASAHINSWYWDGERAMQPISTMEERYPDAVTVAEYKAAGNWFTTKAGAEGYGREIEMLKHQHEGQRTCKPTKGLLGFDPERDDFYAWSAKKGRAIQCGRGIAGTEEERATLISIGNCFATREETENEGKWLFQDKLVLDAELRKNGCEQAVKSLCWHEELNKVCYYIPYPTEAMEQAVAILSTNAKRYLTGEE